MSDDLAQRLRFLASGQDDPQSVALVEAADEIKRLRAERVVDEALLRQALEAMEAISEGSHDPQAIRFANRPLAALRERLK
jgi:hypothetical protein